MSDVPAKIRRLVVERDKGKCVRCGARTTQLQHRLPRGRGGKNTPANLILACGSGTTGCHGQMESFRLWAYDRGYLIHTTNPPTDPTTVPLVTYVGTRWLDDEGNYHVLSPEERAEPECDGCERCCNHDGEHGYAVGDCICDEMMS